MPALVFLKRRWRIGSDDFVFAGLFEIVLRLAWLILVVLLFVKHQQVPCKDGSMELRIYLSGVMVMLLAIIIVTVILITYSGRGGVMDTDARAAVPTVLTIRVVMGLPELGWNIMGSVWIFTGAINCDENAPLWIWLKALLIVTWVLLFVLIVAILFLFEPMHRPHYSMSSSHTTSSYALNDGNLGTHYISLWEWRCRVLCCASAKDETSLEALRNVADVLASIFEDNDLVASDIAAGLVLLRLKHKYQEKRDKRAISRKGRAEQKIQEQKNNINSIDHDASINVEGVISDNNPEVANREILHSHDTPSTSSCPTAHTVHFSPDTVGSLTTAGVSPTENSALPPPHPWMTLANARYYMKFALASYGWPWYVYGKCCSAMGGLWPHLNCFTTCCCREQPNTTLGDNCCLCHFAAMRAVTKLNEEDFLYIHYANFIYQVPFLVAVDRDTKSIVVAIRGTMSLKDTITDMTAQTASVYDNSSESSPRSSSSASSMPDDEPCSSHINTRHCLAHKGMVNAANFVYETLMERTGVLARALHTYPGYTVVVTGHSLGAGAAVILAAKLRHRQADLLDQTNSKSNSRLNDSTEVGTLPNASSGIIGPSDAPDSILINSNIKCFAYSPPGGLCSEEFAEHTRDFVMSVVVGDDLVPRLSVHSLHNLREQVLQVLSDCGQPKYRLLAQGCWFMLFGISEKNLKKGFQEVHGEGSRKGRERGRRRRRDPEEEGEANENITSDVTSSNSSTQSPSPHPPHSARDSSTDTSSGSSMLPLLHGKPNINASNYESIGTQDCSITLDTETCRSSTSEHQDRGGIINETNDVSVSLDDSPPHSPQRCPPLECEDSPSTPPRECVPKPTPRHTETFLCLPGHVLFIRPASVKTPHRWRVVWRSCVDFKDLIISPWMMRHHLPQEVMAALDFAADQNKQPPQHCVTTPPQSASTLQ